MLSFCAQPQGGVAESIIERITLSLLDRGDRGRRWVRFWVEHFPHPPSSDLTGTFSQGEGFPSHFETVDSATSGRDALRAE